MGSFVFLEYIKEIAFIVFQNSWNWFFTNVIHGRDYITACNCMCNKQLVPNIGWQSISDRVSIFSYQNIWTIRLQVRKSASAWLCGHFISLCVKEAIRAEINLDLFLLLLRKTVWPQVTDIWSSKISGATFLPVVRRDCLANLVELEGSL